MNKIDFSECLNCIVHFQIYSLTLLLFFIVSLFVIVFPCASVSCGVRWPVIFIFSCVFFSFRLLNVSFNFTTRFIQNCTTFDGIVFFSSIYFFFYLLHIVCVVFSHCFVYEIDYRYPKMKWKEKKIQTKCVHVTHCLSVCRLHEISFELLLWFW